MRERRAGSTCQRSSSSSSTRAHTRLPLLAALVATAGAIASAARAATVRQSPPAPPTAASQPASSQPAPATFAFTWPIGTQGRVVEAASKDGIDLSISAHLELQRAADGALVLARTDPRIESYRGYEPTNHFVSKLVLQLEQSSPVQPSLSLGADGALRGLSNYDEIVLDTLAKLATSGASAEEQKAQTDVLLSAAGRARVERQVREQWDNWFGHWAGIPLGEPWSEERELAVELPKGRKGRTGSVKRSYHGREQRRDKATHHFARFEQRQGPWFLQLALPRVSALMPGLAISDVREIVLIDQTEAWIAADTGLPVEVSRRSQWRVAIEGAEPRKTELITQWTFDWGTFDWASAPQSKSDAAK